MPRFRSRRSSAGSYRSSFRGRREYRGAGVNVRVDHTFVTVLLVACCGFVLAPTWRCAAGPAPMVPVRTLESQYYHRIDIDRAAKAQWGPGATAVCPGPHLFDWGARVGGEMKGMDLRLAVTRQYGPDWVIAATGVGRFDWVAVHFEDLHDVVLPIMPVPADEFHDIEAVTRALERYQASLLYASNWYTWQSGKPLHILRPLVFRTDRTTSSWNALAADTLLPTHRADYFAVAVDAFARSLRLPPGACPVMIAPFGGRSVSLWQGTAEGVTGGGFFAVAPPGATSLDSPLPLAFWLNVMLAPLLPGDRPL